MFKIKSFLSLFFFLFGLALAPLNAAQYWELTPHSYIAIEEKVLYQYLGTVLIARPTETSCEILLKIQDGREEKRSTQTWIKSSDGKNQFNRLSMGDQVVVIIDPMHPQEVMLEDPKDSFEPFSVQSSFPYINTKNWIIPPSIIPISQFSLTLDGIDYDIYSGTIIKSLYTTWIEDTMSDHFEWMIHQLDIEIALHGEGGKSYIDFRKDQATFIDGSGHKVGGEGFKDNFLRMLRNWTTSDQVKILVNCYYPGFWWIVNESRNEAIFVAHGRPLALDANLWQRLGS